MLQRRDDGREVDAAAVSIQLGFSGVIQLQFAYMLWIERILCEGHQCYSLFVTVEI
jgi:hypothetical protein